MVESVHTNDGLPPGQTKWNQSTAGEKGRDVAIDEQPYWLCQK
jgi:hypothetical protein